MRKKPKEKREYISAWIETSKIDLMDDIIDHENNAFLDDRSKVIRYALRQQLPKILKELDEEKLKEQDL